MVFAAAHESAVGRFCCKSLFATAIKNSFGRRRDFRVKMWGTSSPEDKLTGDLANAIEAISIDDRGSDCLAAGKLAPGYFGLFQQHPVNCTHYRAAALLCASPQLAESIRAAKRFRVVPTADVSRCSKQAFAGARPTRSPRRRARAASAACRCQALWRS